MLTTCNSLGEIRYGGISPNDLRPHLGGGLLTRIITTNRTGVRGKNKRLGLAELSHQVIIGICATTEPYLGQTEDERLHFNARNVVGGFRRADAGRIGGGVPILAYRALKAARAGRFRSDAAAIHLYH